MFFSLPDPDPLVRGMYTEHWHAGSAAMDYYLKMLPVCLHQAATGTVLEDSCNFQD
jgi:hypothetical protein